MIPKYNIYTVKNKIQFCLDEQETVWKSSPGFPWLENMHINTVIETCKRKGWRLENSLDSTA